MASLRVALTTLLPATSHKRALSASMAVFMALLTGLPVLAQSPSDLRSMASAQLGALEPATAEEAAMPRAMLGQALFWDMRLSADGRTACASCHIPDNAGSDPRPLSVNARGALTSLHSLTVFNAQEAQAGLRWFADRPSGAAQALGSITGSMGFETREDILPALQSAGYDAAFQMAFPEDSNPMTVNNYGVALEDYQRTLRTPAPFDAWLQGDDSAMNAQQLQGLQRFVSLGCASCHNGPLLGGASLQRFGVVADYAQLTGSPEPHAGLASVTGNAADQFRFRVPPLRNVAATPPYFHDGSVPELAHAVDIMARVQLGQTLDDQAIADVAAFLHTLTGPMPENFVPPEGVPFELPEGLGR